MFMFKPLFKIYKQLQSENRCIIIKEKYFINNAIKKQMHQNNIKILYKQMQSANRCTKMHIGIHTKYMGNCLDNIVLSKNRYLKYKYILSKRQGVKKESQTSWKEAKKAIWYFTVTHEWNDNCANLEISERSKIWRETETYKYQILLTFPVM